MGTPRKKPITKRPAAPPKTPKQPKAWDRPESPAKGDRREAKIHTAVGSALSSWEELEYQLGEIFVALVVGRSNEALRAYGAVLANSTRQDMIHAAAGAFFLVRDNENSTRIQADLKSLMDAVEGFAPRRNEIAHGVVTVYPIRDWDKGAADDAVDFTFVLGPSYYANKKRPMFRVQGTAAMGLSSLYQYSAAQILAFGSHFQRLRQTATKIAHAIRHQRVRERQASPQKSP